MEPSPILVVIREDEQQFADLYLLVVAAQDALGELAEALENLD